MLLAVIYAVQIVQKTISGAQHAARNFGPNARHVDPPALIHMAPLVVLERIRAS